MFELQNRSLKNGSKLSIFFILAKMNLFELTTSSNTCISCALQHTYNSYILQYWQKY